MELFEKCSINQNCPDCPYEYIQCIAYRLSQVCVMLVYISCTCCTYLLLLCTVHLEDYRKGPRDPGQVTGSKDTENNEKTNYIGQLGKKGKARDSSRVKVRR